MVVRLITGCCMDQIRESLTRDLATVAWRDLRVHLQRDAVILVDRDIDIIDAAVAVARDDETAVEQWIAAGKIGKPDQDQLDVWESDLEHPLHMLIVQPFILTQEAGDA